MRIDYDFHIVVGRDTCDRIFLAYNIPNSIVNSIIFSGPNGVKYLQSFTKYLR